jgi:outer membrane protein assembly factor BamB
MNEIYLVGAEQNSEHMKEWQKYKKGVVFKIDIQTQQLQKVLDYESPKEVCPEDPSIQFTAATLKEGKMYVGTQTEVLVYNIDKAVRENYISLPVMNDIHHVKPRVNGNLLIVNTGLDMVIECTPGGEIVNLWNVLGDEPWSRFDPLIDYRKVASTKPHQSHPNFVFEFHDQIWVTRCLQKDAVCITDSSQQINIGRQLIHDGVVYKGHIYFTQVDGRVVIVNAATLKVEREVNLVQISGHKENIGWCRGIMPLSKDVILVGFSRIRPKSKKAEDGSISYEGDYGVLPTRLACFNIKENKLMWEKNVEGAGLNAIYSIN